ncbi:hypothetical protein [Rhodalgimonas zhirmunskyi]|uniref:Lipoprotein n=1 Tax=Rhodalgimonas zhirmunskyi TaxID=2964767 RepID=A0AAJ1U4K6_9RHOB|nr:hypothetical protein [Rhodoalgimonas zhirmunskyi]MDQ2093080.1 hypothetical protein [Rhodoalgimonas zhirmunskyi]
MRIPVLALLIAATTLSACSTRLNPLNWFGRSRVEAPRAEGTANPLIPERSSMFRRNREEVYLGIPVDQITALRAERNSGGAVLRIEARAATQGAFDVRVVKDKDAAPGTLSYTLKAVMPANRRVGPASSRGITAAKFISENELQEVRKIIVNGARNALSVTR